MLRGPLGIDADDATEMQPHPYRTDTPSLGSERVRAGTLPVIHFDGESWTLPAGERGKIQTVARWLTGHPERALLSAGAHASSPEYARQLSDLRAQTVRQALITAGAPASKITTVSFGEDAPAATGDGVSFSLIATGE